MSPQPSAPSRAHGDVVLVGHPEGGTVISEAGNAARVKSLVYVAAFAPDSGQSTADLAGATPAPPGSAGIAKTAEGFLWLPENRYAGTLRQILRLLSKTG